MLRYISFLRKIATNTESVIKDHHFPYLETLQFDWLPSTFSLFFTALPPSTDAVHPALPDKKPDHQGLAGQNIDSFSFR